MYIFCPEVDLSVSLFFLMLFTTSTPGSSADLKLPQSDSVLFVVPVVHVAREATAPSLWWWWGTWPYPVHRAQRQVLVLRYDISGSFVLRRIL